MTEYETNAELWKKLNIQLTLEGEGFPDDKIYGYIDVNPPSSRQLIKSFKLVIDDNKKNPVEFDARFENFSASGFQHSEKSLLRELYVEAIPNEKYRNFPAKLSNVCSFFFNGVQSFFNPKLRFSIESKEKSSPDLTITWRHVGDENVQKYRLYLDDVEIHEIGLDSISETFKVVIRHWEIGKSHSIQIAGFRNNRKETYRSDLLKFVVPNGTQEEVICVNDDPMPSSLTILVGPVGSYKGDRPVKIPASGPKLEKEICCCGAHLPHDTFPGIDHYFMIPDNFSQEKKILTN